jgi:hypothetical protein
MRSAKWAIPNQVRCVANRIPGKLRDNPDVAEGKHVVLLVNFPRLNLRHSFEEPFAAAEFALGFVGGLGLQVDPELLISAEETALLGSSLRVVGWVVVGHGNGRSLTALGGGMAEGAFRYPPHCHRVAYLSRLSKSRTQKRRGALC